MTSSLNSGPNVVDGEDGEEASPNIKFRSSTPIPPFLTTHISESNPHCPVELALLVLF